MRRASELRVLRRIRFRSRETIATTPLPSESLFAAARSALFGPIASVLQNVGGGMSATAADAAAAAWIRPPGDLLALIPGDGDVCRAEG
jgi:hypothetical protein